MARDNHAAFAGGDLLVGVEGEDPGVAEGADPAAANFRADGLASVFNDAQVVTVCNFKQGRNVGGTAESVHGDERARVRRDGGLDPGGGEVERFGVDIRENGESADVADSVGYGDEGEGRDDDLVARADAQGQ